MNEDIQKLRFVRNEAIRIREMLLKLTIEREQRIARSVEVLIPNFDPATLDQLRSVATEFVDSAIRYAFTNVPKRVGILSRIFGTKDTAYLEHLEKVRIKLRGWASSARTPSKAFSYLTELDRQIRDTEQTLVRLENSLRLLRTNKHTSVRIGGERDVSVGNSRRERKGTRISSGSDDADSGFLAGVATTLLDTDDTTAGPSNHRFVSGGGSSGGAGATGEFSEPLHSHDPSAFVADVSESSSPQGTSDSFGSMS